jgi:hypothetical protein
VTGKSRPRVAAEQIAELVTMEKKTKALTRQLKDMVLATGSTLMELAWRWVMGRLPPLPNGLCTAPTLRQYVAGIGAPGPPGPAAKEAP